MEQPADRGAQLLNGISGGFMTDRDYRNRIEDRDSLESWISSRLGISDLLFAASDRVLRRQPVLWTL
jgi:hypothetical protein